MPATWTIEPYAGWSNCLRGRTGATEIVVTTDVGPRVLYCGPARGPNLLLEVPRHLGRTGGKRWRMFGGHRLWTAPEIRRLTYVPDNEPVRWTVRGATLHLVQRADPVTGLRKELHLTLERGALRLEHRLVNEGRRAVRRAPWALTVMAPGGRAVFPQERYGSHRTHLLPARPLVLWKYTNMADPRWRWGRRLLQLQQDPHATNPQKAGFFSTRGWMAYLTPHATFVKRHPVAGGEHPDAGCNVETFTNEDFLELETLGPLADLGPGGGTRHVEVWKVFPQRLLGLGEAALEARLQSLAAAMPAP